MKIFRGLSVFLILSVVVIPSTNSYASERPSASIGAKCSQNGISALYQGQVITCASGIWRSKTPIKIGTSNRTQSLVSDLCVTPGVVTNFSEIVYICTRTPSGNRWEIAPRIKVATRVVSQDILDKACAPIGLVNILNGESYTCTYGFGSAHWSQTDIIQISTALRKTTIDNTKCAQPGDITILNGTYYVCNGNSASNLRWKKIQPNSYPTIIQKSAVIRGANDLAAQIQNANRKTVPSVPLSRDLSSCHGKISTEWRASNVNLLITNYANCSTLILTSGNVDCVSGSKKITTFWKQKIELGPRSAVLYSASTLFTDALGKCRSALDPYATLSFNGPLEISQLGFE